ncbi:hypothetical protein ACIQW9_05085 [Herminiimonas sp. NPDC097707]|uniref:hypothetical protein n=1 Tax=Herminiimonas sp. NPDC097707 TaxID=3364007 RepID=UPI00383AF3DE
MIRALLISILALTVFGCSEKIQSQDKERVSGDVPPYKGAVNDPYVIKGWTAGNKTEWDKQMHERAQTQNEYLKVN